MHEGSTKRSVAQSVKQSISNEVRNSDLTVPDVMAKATDFGFGKLTLHVAIDSQTSSSHRLSSPHLAQFKGVKTPIYFP